MSEDAPDGDRLPTLAESLANLRDALAHPDAPVTQKQLLEVLVCIAGSLDVVSLLLAEFGSKLDEDDLDEARLGLVHALDALKISGKMIGEYNGRD